MNNKPTTQEIAALKEGWAEVSLVMRAGYALESLTTHCTELEEQVGTLRESVQCVYPRVIVDRVFSCRERYPEQSDQWCRSCKALAAVPQGRFERMEKALEFYAKGHNSHGDGHYHDTCDVCLDYGEQARAALEES
jgi:hypothetical protein